MSDDRSQKTEIRQQDRESKKQTAEYPPAMQNAFGLTQLLDINQVIHFVPDKG
jgi:hypothetical protein